MWYNFCLLLVKQFLKQINWCSWVLVSCSESGSCCTATCTIISPILYKLLYKWELRLLKVSWFIKQPQADTSETHRAVVPVNFTFFEHRNSLKVRSLCKTTNDSDIKHIHSTAVFKRKDILFINLLPTTSYWWKNAFMKKQTIFFETVLLLEHKHRRKTCQCWQWPNVGKKHKILQDCMECPQRNNVPLLGRRFNGKFHKETLWWEKKLKENFGIRKPKSRVIIRNLVHAVDTNLETEKTHVFLVTNTLNLIGWNRNKQPTQRL